jgi:type II secretory pathway predicted ATPase ExeA
MLAPYGLKWNPFSPAAPLEALRVAPNLELFCRRLENLAREGGFALCTGEPGSGKSSALRILEKRLGALPDVKVGVLTRPQSRLADFFREMGDLFGVTLSPHNRWAGSKVLRERWQAHIEAALARPVLIIDEAQEMLPSVLNELRLLSSSRLDSHLLLTVVLAGDQRLLEKLQSNDLLPLSSRVRVRILLARLTPAELAQCLRHALDMAGAPQLMTQELLLALAEHANGNLRSLMSMAAELLAVATQRELRQLDEKLFLEVFAPSSPKSPPTGRRR